MAELFLVGTFWFWFLIVAEVLLLFCCIANESGLWATLSLVAVGVLLQLCGNTNWLGYVKDHPWHAVGFVFGYFAIGVLWTTFRFRMFLRKKHDEMQEEWLTIKGIRNTFAVPTDLQPEWQQYAKGHTPQVGDYKSDIMRWMGYWIVSMIWYVIHDFVVEICQTIYRHVAVYLQAMADRMFYGGKDSTS